MDIRQHIIETAYQCFYRQGFHASGVETLARQAGTTKRTLYAHFGSKDGLIEAVMQFRHRQFIEQLQAALAQRPVHQTAGAYVDFIADWSAAAGFAGCLFINACAEFADDHTLPHRYAAEHKRSIRTLLQQRLQAAGFEDVEAAANRLFVLGEGLIVAAQTGQSDVLAYRQQWVAEAGLLSG